MITAKYLNEQIIDVDEARQLYSKFNMSIHKVDELSNILESLQEQSVKLGNKTLSKNIGSTILQIRQIRNRIGNLSKLNQELA